MSHAGPPSHSLKRFPSIVELRGIVAWPDQLVPKLLVLIVAPKELPRPLKAGCTAHIGIGSLILPIRKPAELHCTLAELLSLSQKARYVAAPAGRKHRMTPSLAPQGPRC